MWINAVRKRDLFFKKKGAEQEERERDNLSETIESN